MNATIPGKLKTFNYEIGCTWAWCDIDHPAIMKSLRAHHNTLEDLGLSHEDFYPFQFGNEQEKPYPCFFGPFKALKRLKVAPVYIWGHDGFTKQEQLAKSSTKEMLWKALPENLEELWITRANAQEEEENAHRPTSGDDGSLKVQFEPHCLLPALDLVVQHKSSAFPRLCHFRIEFPLEVWENEWLDSLGNVCNIARVNGINTTIILTGLLKGVQADVERGWGWDEDVQWTECWANQESQKMWIAAADEDDLSESLRHVKRREKEEVEKSRQRAQELEASD